LPVQRQSPSQPVVAVVVVVAAVVVVVVVDDDGSSSRVYDGGVQVVGGPVVNVCQCDCA